MHASKLASLLVLVVLLCGSGIAGAQAQPAADPVRASDNGLIARLDQATGGTRVFRHAATGKVRFLSTADGGPLQQLKTLAASTPEQSARAFLSSYGQLFGVRSPDRELQSMQQEGLANRSFVRFQQTYQGVPIIGGELIVQTGDQGAVMSVNGEALPDIRLSVQPGISSADAVGQAVALVAKHYGVPATKLRTTTPQLWIYNPALLGGPGPQVSQLVWRLDVTSAAIRELVLIDAQTGDVTLNFSQIADAKNRVVCNDNNVVDVDGNETNNCTPAKYVRVEGQPTTGNTDVDLAYDFAGITYDYYRNNFGRDSLDGKGLPLVSLVKYCTPTDDCPYANAFWDGQQMTYGDGYASADDVVGHELTHGFTEFTSHLFYYYQSGAINESLSDVFGELIDLTDGRGNDSANVRWLLGEDLPQAVGIVRNMKDPPNVPGHLGDPIYQSPDRTGSVYYRGDSTDNGWVHINSGVNNKAAYLMTDGGTFNGQTIEGLGPDKVGAIYYTLQVAFLTSASDYQDLYTDLPAACNTLAASGAYGLTKADCVQVLKAVTATEMNVPPPAAPATEAPLCAPGLVNSDRFTDNLENPASGNWATSAAAGGVAWYYPANNNPLGRDSTYATSGVNNFWGRDPAVVVDTSIAMTRDVAIPPNAFLRFSHAFQFESLIDVSGTTAYDGGVVEYSADGGATWHDAGPLFAASGGVNGYNVTLETGGNNPLEGQDAFGGISQGYISSRADLGALAGQNVRFRFRIGSDAAVGTSFGWYIDDVKIYSCITPQRMFLPLVDV